MMKYVPGRKCLFHYSVLAGFVSLLAPTSAQSQATDWPNRPVTVVVAFAAGGNSDIMARMAAQKMSDELKQSFVVENRVGAGGALAASYVAQAAPDGYTIFFAASPQISVVPYISKVNYDPTRDFVPVSAFGTGPFILAINPKIPATTLTEFVEYSKTRTLNYGSGGIGSIAHLTTALFLSRANLQGVHVPFRGGGPAMNALLGGQIDLYFGNASEIIPHADGGKIRLLGIAADRRMKQLPDVPTIGENYPNTVIPGWNGFFAPAKTPKPIIDKLAKHVIAAARDPSNIAQLTRLGIEPDGTSPEEFAAKIEADQPVFDAAIKAAGIKPE